MTSAGAVSLVVTDLDGTLWERPDEVHPRTLAAVDGLRERGVPLLVATGRRVASTREPLAELGLAPPAVVLNGGLGLDLATGDRFHRGGFTQVDAQRVLAAFERHGIEPCVYVDHDERTVWVGERPSTHPDHLASLGAEVVAGDLSAVVVEHHVLAFAVLGIPQAAADSIAATAATVGTCHVSPDRIYAGSTVTVAPTTVSKWDGVLAYCRHAGLDPSGVLAIGDGPNDAELLAGARTAVAMADAHPAALAVADHVVGPAVDGGWADLLDLVDRARSPAG